MTMWVGQECPTHTIFADPYPIFSPTDFAWVNKFK
jgi:hypothetical protein